jgi:hypothetical protein
MKIYKTQSEVEKDIKNGLLVIEGDVKFECSINIDASIVVTAGDLTARDITAGDISVKNITAWNLTAWNISAGDISVKNLTAGDISAGDISVRNITARDITVRNISAEDISFYAICFAYSKFVCKSIKGRRDNSKYGCLDGEVEIIKNTPKETIVIGGITYSKEEVENALKNIQSLTTNK